MIPGPKVTYGGLGTVSHVIDFFRNPIATMRVHNQEFGQISGLLSTVEDGKKGFIFAFGADYNRAVFSKQQRYHSSAMLNIADSSVQNLSNGLTFMNGDEHMAKRRLIMPAFHKQYLENYRHNMVSITDDMLKKWQVGSTINISNACHDLTANIAIRTLFGLDAEKEGHEMSRLIAQWMTLATSPLLRLMPFDLPLSPVRNIRQISHKLENHMLKLIRRKRKTAAQDNDILATLIQTVDDNGNKMSDDDIIGQVNVLFLAGHETSANALTWTLFLLSQFPQILQDVVDELSGVLGGDAPTVEQLGQLPFLENVIKESMRILPPVVWIQRIAKENTRLIGHEIAKDSTLILSHYMTHQNPDIYSKPLDFNPYRWYTLKPAPYEYMAFSAGPRMCIGAGFAMMEMKIVLAMILQRYQLELASNTQIDRHVTVTLSTKKGIPMKIQSKTASLSRHVPTGNIHELVNLA